MIPDNASQSAAQDRGHILRFERRGAAALRGRTPFSAPPGARTSPVEGLEKYVHRNEQADDDRHRMIGNVVASAILLFLIVCGVWLSDTIIRMRNSQDCVLSGRSNCAPIERSAHDRQ
jgi:hypothetical protein